MVLMEDDVRKVDCLTVLDAAKELGVARSTVDAYIRAFQVKKHKFLFDTKVYVAKSDVEYIRQRIEEGG